MSKVLTVPRQLFGTPVPLERKPFVKTYHLGVVTSDSGESVIETKCVETEMNKIVALDYVQTTLSTLVAKGIDPHSLDIIDSSKIGCDAGIDQLAQYLVDHTSDYVVLPKKIEDSVQKVVESK